MSDDKTISIEVDGQQLEAQPGQMLIEVSVDAKGKVTNVQQHHSSLADKGVGTCAKGVLKKLKFPELAADAASVNVTMYFTFEDQ